MSNTWVTSDHHFGHANILKFVGQDGKPFRHDTDVHAMDEALVDAWNSVVKPEDTVYHLGDVAFANNLHYVSQLNGLKHLALGNHDRFRMTEYYAVGFLSVRGSFKRNRNILMSHFPIHISSIPRGAIQIHGHIHEKPSPKGPYFNVSVERNAYRPFNLDEILKWQDDYLAGLEMDSFLREMGSS